MRKGKSLFLCSSLAVIFSAGIMNVNAATSVNVDTWDNLKTCLTTDGNTCVLSNDISGAEKITISSNTVTLDLNDKKLSLGTGQQDVPISVTSTGKLTVIDSGTKGEIAGAQRGLEVTTGGTIDVQDGTISNTRTTGGAGIKVLGTATDTGVKTTLTIGKNALVYGTAGIGLFNNGTASYGVVIDVYGTVEGRQPGTGEIGTAAISVQGKIKDKTGNIPVINIYDGAVVTGKKGSTGDINRDDAPGLYLAGYAKVNVFGGTLTGCEAIAIKSGILNITGGTFIATGVFTDPAVAKTGGSEATGAAISITKNANYIGDVEVSISNAVIKSTNGYALYEAPSTGNTGTAVKSMEILSGTFEGAEAVGAIYSDGVTEFIEGGTFSSALDSSYIPQTIAYAVENGRQIVGDKHTITVGKVENGSISLSLSEAISGQTITITVSPKSGYVLKSINGATVTKVNDTTYTFVMEDNDMTITPVFEAEAAAIENPKTLDGIYISLAACAISASGIAILRKKAIKN